MKPHPRIRKTIKWGGAAVTVLLVVVWVGSGWLSVGWVPGLWSIDIAQGQMWYSKPAFGLPQIYRTDRTYAKI